MGDREIKKIKDLLLQYIDKRLGIHIAILLWSIWKETIAFFMKKIYYLLCAHFIALKILLHYGQDRNSRCRTPNMEKDSKGATLE